MSGGNSPTTDHLQNHYASTVYDKLYYENQVTKSPYLKRIGLNNIYEILKSRRSYDYLKIVALERWYKSLSEQLESFQLIFYCREYDDRIMEKISHDVFNWSYDEHIKRINLDDCVWIQILLRGSSAKCLTQMKMKTDIRELKKYAAILYELIMDLLVHGKEPDVEEKMCRPLREAQQYAQTLDEIDMTGTKLNSHVTSLRHLTLAENVIAAIMLQTKKFNMHEKVTAALKQEHKKFNMLEATVVFMHVWVPIESRYEINWFNSVGNQKQYRQDVILNRLHQDIYNLKVKTLKERNCSGSVCDSYYAETEDYKRRIRELQQRFDDDIEEIEGNMLYTQNQIDKFHNMKRNRLERIERFHFEIAQRLAKEERWRKKEEDDRLAAEAAGLAKYRAEKLKRQMAVLKALKAKTDIKGKYERQKVIDKMEKRIKSIIEFQEYNKNLIPKVDKM